MDLLELKAITTFRKRLQRHSDALLLSLQQCKSRPAILEEFHRLGVSIHFILFAPCGAFVVLHCKAATLHG